MHIHMKDFAVVKKHDCVSAFFAVKELGVPAIIAVMIKGAVCE